MHRGHRAADQRGREHGRRADVVRLDLVDRRILPIGERAASGRPGQVLDRGRVDERREALFSPVEGGDFVDVRTDVVRIESRGRDRHEEWPEVGSYLEFRHAGPAEGTSYQGFLESCEYSGKSAAERRRRPVARGGSRTHYAADRPP